LSELAGRYGITLNGLSASVTRFKADLLRGKNLDKELQEIENIISTNKYDPVPTTAAVQKVREKNHITFLFLPCPLSASSLQNTGIG
jgi:hypothetical protein